MSEVAGSSYLEAGRGRSWWKPFVEVLLAVVWWFVAGAVIGAVFLGAAHAKKFKQLDTLSHLSFLHLSIAAMIPAAFAAAHVMGRKGGFLFSTLGRLRWAWLGRCVCYALLGQAAFVALVVIGELVTEGSLGKLAAGGPSFGGFVALTIALVPLQATGEEVFNRGTLQQTVGAYRGPAWLAVVLSTAAFAAMHGKPNVGTIAIVAMGVVFACLTLLTGGLEAAIAGHAINNIVAFILAAAIHGTDELDPQKLNARVGLGSVIIQLATLAIYTVLVVRAWRRREPR